MLSQECFNLNVITDEAESIFPYDFNDLSFFFCELSGNLTSWASLRKFFFFFLNLNRKAFGSSDLKGPPSLHMLLDSLIFKNIKGNAIYIGKSFVGASQMREYTPEVGESRLFLDSSAGVIKPGSFWPRWWGEGSGKR